MEQYTIEQYTKKSFREGDLDQIQALYRQLFSGKRSEQIYLDRISMDRFFESCSVMWVARMGSSRIVAIGTLIRNEKLIPGESFFSVQDIVTDENHRGKVCSGQSLGEHILKKMIEYVRGRHSYKYLELTSAPKRIAANKLYQRLGFKLLASGETNLYRFSIRYS